MSFLFGILGLISIVICVLWVLHIQFKMPFGEMRRAFFYGMLAAFIIKGLVYGIGKEMNIDFYFFEIRVLGKNGLQHFENMYVDFIKNISVQFSFIYILGTILLPATLEELGKLGSLTFMKNRFEQVPARTIRGYIERMIIIAIGFSFLENIFYLGFYFEKGVSSVELLQLMTLRVSLSTASHILFSGIFAYYYARFAFGRYDLVDTGGFGEHKKMVSLLKRFHLFYSPLFSFAYSSRLLFLGAFFAIGGHILYNFFIYLHYDIVSFFFLVVGWIVFHMLILKDNPILDKNLGIIQEKIKVMRQLRDMQKRKEEIFSDQ